ncbi:MAG: divalent-cation tolerance protein CutA [Calditrichia bacterium]
MNAKYVLGFCTVPDAPLAGKIAKTLVEERLAACCNIIPGITSVYRWEKEVQTDSELLLLIKTSEERFDELKKRILELHPYDVPEIITTSISEGHIEYLKWIGENVR